MANPAGEPDGGALRLDFERRLLLPFRSLVITSDAGLLACRRLDEAFGLSAIADEKLADVRTAKTAGTLWPACSGRHALVGMSREAVFRRNAFCFHHARAYNLCNFLRTPTTPESIEEGSLASLKEKSIEIGAKVVIYGRYVAFQMAEVAILRTHP